MENRKLHFRDQSHEEHFYLFLKKANVKVGDSERISLFYILSLFDDTRRNIQDIYDFDDNRIKIDALSKGWQTGGSRRATLLAFNLYNNYSDENGDTSPRSIFEVDDLDRGFMLFAINLRFSSHRAKFIYNGCSYDNK